MKTPAFLQQWRHFLRHLPTRLVLEHPRFLEALVLLLSLAVSAWLAVRFLLLEPPASPLPPEAAVGQLSTDTLDELELYIESRQQEYEQPIVLPGATIFYGGD